MDKFGMEEGLDLNLKKNLGLNFGPSFCQLCKDRLVPETIGVESLKGKRA